MKYRMKREIAEQLDRKYRRQKFVDELGFTKSYLSLVFCGKRTVRKVIAYAITKSIDINKEIEEFFDEV